MKTHEHQTTPQAQAFLRAVERNLEGLEAFSVGACPGCEACGLSEDPTEDERDLADEAHFSWSACESCGSSLGGNRHAAHYLDEGEIQHLSVCVDCLHFHANGDLPDTWEG